MANYGDYLGQELQELPVELKEAAKIRGKAVEEAALALGPSRRWVRIADELSESDSIVIAAHVRVASGVLGIDAHHMSWLIKEWGARCRNFHNSAREYIEDCRWSRLRNLLCRDLKELLMVTDAETAFEFKKMLPRLAHKYFDINDYDDSET